MVNEIPHMNDYLLQVLDLKTYFPIRQGLLRRTVGYIKAVDGVTITIKAGRTLGLVGESGSGKTTLAHSIVRLIPVTTGRILFAQMDVLSADKPRLRQIRKQIGLVFQNPFGSLNPRMTIGNIIGEPLKVHSLTTDRELPNRIATWLSRVGLSPDHINRYPHEFSAGQRQRIAIARAIAVEPKLVLWDEPVSALDVSTQAQILNLLKDLQDQFSLTYLFITHNLTLVEYFCDVVAVMYKGKIVEHAPAGLLFENPLHPYTRNLMASARWLSTGGSGTTGLFSERSDSAFMSVGCPFHPDCPYAQEYCPMRMPPLLQIPTEPQHEIACWKFQ
jgi:oligopeptide transport system ATP-binding protein